MSKLNVYEGIACLEVPSDHGHLWWYQGARLAFSPLRVAAVPQVVVAQRGVRTLWAVPLELPTGITLVALNLPRTDTRALKRRGLLPPDIPDPEGPYAPWPLYARQNPDLV